MLQSTIAKSIAHGSEIAVRSLAAHCSRRWSLHLLDATLTLSYKNPKTVGFCDCVCSLQKNSYCTHIHRPISVVVLCCGYVEDWCRHAVATWIAWLCYCSSCSKCMHAYLSFRTSKSSWNNAGLHACSTHYREHRFGSLVDTVVAQR